MLNMETYCELMHWGDPNEENTPVDKLIVRLNRNDEATIREVQQYIQEFYADEYEFSVSQPASMINMMQETDNTINTILEIVLFTTVIISLFGLMSAMYSMMMERMFEIGVLRAMGMKTHEVRTMFIAESTTLLLAAGGLGTIIGALIAYLLQMQMGMITEIPVVFTMNWAQLLRTFGICIAVSIVGMLGITQKMSKWSIMEVFRQSF